MKLINIIGQRFERLIVLERIKNKWLCKCDCGIEKLISYQNLKHGTKSCGCYNKDRIKTIPKSFNNIKYSPEISSARRAWKNKYSDGNLTFKDFYKLSKQNCYYCNSNPSQIFSIRKNGEFVYNGLDRIDPTQSHNLDNVVACCYTCNRFKSNQSQQDFLLWASKIKEKNFSKHIIKQVNLNSYQISNLKKIWSDTYNKEIDFNLFLSISQENCFYCNSKPNNFCHYQNNKKYSSKANQTGRIYYSGLDRFTNKPTHEIDDIVPCCKICNFAKSDMQPNDFYQHVKRINENQQINNS